jgi:proline iminopeptidase
MAWIAAGLGLAIFLGAVPAVGAPHSAAAPISVGEHSLTVDGVRLWYRVAGRPRGVPVVFLHGGPGEGSQLFQAVGGPELERTQRLIYFDQRGGGRSDRPVDPSNYSIDIMVEDVEQLRRHLGVPRIVLLGHSFGTNLALEYAARYPQHTAAVVLAAAASHLLRSLDLQCQRLQTQDSEAYARATAGLRAGAFPRCNTMQAYSGDAAKAFAERNLFPDPAVARRVNQLGEVGGLRSTGEVARALFQKGYLQYRFSKTDNVLAPVLVIAGGRDYQAAIEPQRDLVKDLRHARLVEYPRNGHFMFVEDPRRFARDVNSFLRRALSQ